MSGSEHGDAAARGAPAPPGADAVRDFQDALIPPTCTSCGHARVSAAFVPADGVVGGDFHDSIPLGGADGYVIGDVTGHGRSASLVMAVLFGAIREALHHDWKPGPILSRLHAMLVELGERAGGPRLFSATTWVGVLRADGELRYANAGQLPPLLVRLDGTVERLEADRPPLGFPGAGGETERVVQLEPGDRLLLYTDGVFGRDDDVDGLERRVRELGGSTASEIVEALVSGGTADDRTAVMVTYGR